MIEKLLKIANEEIGYLEKASNKDLDDKIANAGKGNYTKYARDLDGIKDFYNGKKNGYPWCDVFVDWCFVQAFGVENAKALLNQPMKSLGAGTTFSAKYFKNKGQFYSIPQTGDQIFFKNGNGDINHTGIVVKVDSNYVYTIEGNTSSDEGVVANGGSVNDKKYKLNYNRIAGYGRPKYSILPEEEPVPTPTVTKKTIDEVAKEVIEGKYGNGEERKEKLEAEGYNYSEVQGRVNEIIKSQQPKEEYYVIEKGDTLTGIAKKFDTTIEKLVELNDIKDPDKIYAGDKIRVK